MILVFDTETTGLPRDFRAPATDLRNWPRLIELAWLLADDAGNEIASHASLVKPDGFIIPPEAVRIHGITTAMAQKDGLAIESVLAAVVPSIEKTSLLVAHNMRFDEKILGAEFLRAGYPDLLETKPRACTMLGATDYCRLPGKHGYKWPNLGELHTKLFGEPLQDSHRAIVDVRACAKCYFELRRLGIMV